MLIRVPRTWEIAVEQAKADACLEIDQFPANRPRGYGGARERDYHDRD